MDDRITKARDIAAPVLRLEIEGVKYDCVYNNRAARVAEDVYETEYGRDIGYAAILEELGKGKMRAVMAILYGAILAGGAEMDWGVFDRHFALGGVEGLREMVARKVAESLPDSEDKPARP